MPKKPKGRLIHTLFARPAEKRTPAYEAFERNTKRLDHLLSMVNAQIGAVDKRVAAYDRKPEPKDRRGISRRRAGIERLKEALAELTGQFELALELQVVLLVTFTETYLQDVLSYAAGFLPELMADSEQKASYSELTSYESLADLASELRGRWARNFVDKGGPSTWIERLSKMGAVGLDRGMADIMEEAWGVRHVVVHRAGVATRDFCNRHPSFGATPGEPLAMRRPKIMWYNPAVADFTARVDEFFQARLDAEAVRRHEAQSPG